MRNLKLLFLAGLLGLGLLAIDAQPAHAQIYNACIACDGPSLGCRPATVFSTSGFCCCNQSCFWNGKNGVSCTCTNFCTRCGACRYTSCNYQLLRCANDEPSTKEGALNDGRFVGPDNRPLGSKFFRYSDHARALVKKHALEQRAPVLIGVLNNITTGKDPAVSGWIGAAPDVTEPRCISGFSDEGNGSFAYKGDVLIEEGHLVINITSQPDKKRKRVRKTVLDIYEEGPADLAVTYEDVQPKP